jgi:GT2 family glycosyltransferase
MDLSIVIVSWNTQSMTRDCLRSVYAGLGALQTQVVVVDNASTDGSQHMIKTEFPQVLLIHNKDNAGFARANNQAFSQCLGRHILLLNSDTLILGQTLEKSVAYLDRNPQVGAMGCRVLNTDGSMQPTCGRFPTLWNLLVLTSGVARIPGLRRLDAYQLTHWDRNDERDVDSVTGCYLMVRHSAMRKVGRLDESFFFYGEETDWCTRFLAQNWAVRFAPVGEIIHHGGASAKKLNHKRDLLLSKGLILLHRKHNGLLSALIAAAILLFFNVSRAILWTLFSLLLPREKNVSRALHFRNIVKNFHTAWPQDPVEKTAALPSQMHAPTPVTRSLP